MYFMDRIETYVGQSILEWNFSKPDQNKMVALGKVISALFGSTTVASGLACTPTSVASMSVNIAPGEIYQMAPLEATVCGTLPSDTGHTIMKQGIALDSVTVPNSSTGVTAFTAPSIVGQSINYLIEAAYADVDVSLDPTTGNSPVVLQFYNATNPASPYQGPNGTGATSNTFRKGTVVLKVKTGVSATTGAQVTPDVDSGYVGLWVVTVATGQTTITAANITTYVGAPILPTSMLAAIQSGSLQYGVDVSTTANVIQGSFSILPTTLVDNQQFWVRIKNTNTGAVTFTPNVGVISAAPVVGAAQVALQGGECVVNGRALLVWRADISSYVLESCTGAALQVTSGIASQHAATLGQVQSGLSAYAIDAGTANTYAVTLSPAITTYTDGVKIRFRALTANTGASTLNVNGLGAVALVGGAHATLAGGEIISGGYCEAEYNGALAKFVLLECTGAALQVAAATQSQHAVTFGQINVAKNLGFAKITTSGNFTTPSNINTSTVFKITLIGGGGGGGGSASSSIGGGGGAGAAASFYISGLSPSTSYAVLIGAGGSGTSSNATNGATGGTTQVTIAGVVYACTGGAGGTSTSTAAVQITASQGTVSTTVSALASCIQINQILGQTGIYAGGNYAGNAGGSVAPYSAGGSGGYTGNGNAGMALGFGGGGGGGVGGGVGGPGSAGLFIAEWVA
jgi:hypothetical protein